MAIDAVFVGLAAVAWLNLYDARYSSWDEFSHWGRVTRAISIEHALPNLSTGILFRDYPPGAALFHYFVLGGRFSEGGTCVAQSLILIGSALAVTVWRGTRRLHVFAATLCAVLLMLGILGQGFRAAEVDHLLGAVFGAAVGSFPIGETWDRRSVAALIPVVGVLPLLKPIGLVFGAAAPWSRWMASRARSPNGDGPLVRPRTQRRAGNGWSLDWRSSRHRLRCSNHGHPGSAS